MRRSAVRFRAPAPEKFRVSTLGSPSSERIPRTIELGQHGFKGSSPPHLCRVVFFGEYDTNSEDHEPMNGDERRGRKSREAISASRPEAT